MVNHEPSPEEVKLDEFGQIISEAFELDVNVMNALGLKACGGIRLVFAAAEMNPEIGSPRGGPMTASEENVFGFYEPTFGTMVPPINEVHEERLMSVSPYSETTELNGLEGDCVYQTVTFSAEVAELPHSAARTASEPRA